MCSAPALLTQDELHVVRSRSALCMCSRPSASRSASAELQPSYSAAAERDSGLQNTVSRQVTGDILPAAAGRLLSTEGSRRVPLGKGSIAMDTATSDRRARGLMASATPVVARVVCVVDDDRTSASLQSDGVRRMLPASSWSSFEIGP